MTEISKFDPTFDNFIKSLIKDSDMEKDGNERISILHQIMKMSTVCRNAKLNTTTLWFIRYGLFILNVDININEIPSSLSEEEKSILLYLLQEFSIVGYYLDLYEVCDKTSDLIMFSKGISLIGVNKDMIHRNQLFYTNKLPIMNKIDVSFTRPLIHETSTERYLPTNPYILLTENGYTIICRCVNYIQRIAGNYFIMSPEKFINTRNFILKTDKNFNVLSQHEIIDRATYRKYNNGVIFGLEDCSLVKIQGKFWFTCVTLNTNSTGKTQVSICQIPDVTNENDDYEVTSLTPLIGPDLRRNEKNWLPFDYNGELCVVYSYDPFTVKKIEFIDDFPSGKTEDIIVNETSSDFIRFRGTGGPLRFSFHEKDGYLFVPHEVIYRGEEGRFYFHRFIWTNLQFQIEAVSSLWYIDHRGVEFCKSIAYSHTPGELLLGVGIEDRKALIYTVSEKLIIKMLH